MNIELTEQEIDHLRQALDVARRHVDRQSARFVMALDIKIESQLSNSAKPADPQ